MAEKELQEQLDELHQKMDMVLEYVSLQNQKREEIDDFVEDAGIVIKDVVRHTSGMLENAQVELDHVDLPGLMIKVLQNLGTFHEMFEMMESAKDFMKDVTPILHQVGLDAVNKMNELDRKGYFEYISELGNFVDKWIQLFTREDLIRLQNNLENIAGIVRNLSDPALMKGLNNMTLALAEVKPDEKLDNKSLFGLFKQLNSPEVRQSLSYSLRLVQQIAKSSK
ncbi:MAG: hypothetical protein NTX43_08370 [Bacteroidetes bacterium]|nr:hypothetical protein [Bacteroidota bacterium]